MTRWASAHLGTGIPLPEQYQWLANVDTLARRYSVRPGEAMMFSWREMLCAQMGAALESARWAARS